VDPQELKLQIAEVAGTWLAAIAVVIGGLFGVFQYLEHKDAVRVDRTMALVERYHSDGLLMNARLQITNAMTVNVEQINSVLTDASIKPEDLAQTYNDTINNIVKKDSLAGPLDQLFTFYEQVVLCRELRLCDDAVAAQFFDDDANSYVRTYYPYICAVRAQWNNPERYSRVVDFYVNESQSYCDS
jgi:hypothetical protein